MPFVIHELDDPWIEALPTTTHAYPLNGSVVFLHQNQGFWIAAEDNDPERITVHVAEKRRYGSVGMMEELTYDNLNGAFAV